MQLIPVTVRPKALFCVSSLPVILGWNLAWGIDVCHF